MTPISGGFVVLEMVSVVKFSCFLFVLSGHVNGLGKQFRLKIAFSVIY